MNFILRTYQEGNFSEYITPNVNNRVIDFEVSFETVKKVINESVVLEVWNSEWTLLSSETIRIKKNGSELEKVNLEDGDLYELVCLNYNVKLYVVVERYYEGYSDFKKYIIDFSYLNIGSLQDNDIVYDFQKRISGHHAIIGKSQNGIFVKDLDSKNGTYVNGVRIIDTYQLSFGDIVDIIGLRIVYLGSLIAINNPKSGIIINGLMQYLPKTSNVEVSNKDFDYYSRSPRQFTFLDSESVEIESPPSAGNSRKQPLMYVIGPSVTMVIPVSVGVLISTYSMSQTGNTLSPMMFMGLGTSITATIIGVFWAITNYRYQRKNEKEDAKLRNDKYRNYLKKTRDNILELQEKNRTILNGLYPNIEICLDGALTRNRRIWERNTNHPDFLFTRLGIGEMKSPNEINIPKEKFSLVDDDLIEEPKNIKNELEVIKNVPICISLLEHNLVGVIGFNSKICFEIAKSLITQISYFHSYNDVKIIYFYDSKHNNDEVDFKWLPHFWSTDEKVRFLSCDTNSAADVSYYLTSVIRERIETEEDDKTSKPLPHYIVFISNPELIENEPISKYLLNPHKKLGLTTVLLYEKIDKLPNNCNIIIQRDDEFSGYYSLNSSFDSFQNLKFDYLSKLDFTRFSKAMANIKLKETLAVGKIPTMLSFLDMYKTNDIEEMDIYRRWLQNRTYESMKALIGYKSNELPIYLDINEKYHGPHGLVAGTTGSGKSEMLQTYILSLATNYHPYEVSFIIIDYKGGGMANSFESLPHLAGIITNLSGNQTNRALTSINSEIKRRQAIFSENKIKHIDEYIELFRSDKVSKPIPHLIIIADEFAELKKEQPDFVRALVSASRVGRSLGVHLILATQKPSGVVDDEIWGNSRFRICLRVQDKQDSSEMLKRSDAAFITNPGRGFFQVGNNEIFEEFQSGWSGATYNKDIEFVDQRNNIVRMINTWGKPLVLNSINKNVNSKSKKKQLSAIVEHIVTISNEKDIKKLDQIWLPPLPKLIYVEDISKNRKNTQDFSSSLPIILGMTDDPTNQKYDNYYYDFIESGNLLIAGSAMSGKTTLLQTILFNLGTNYSVSSVNMYALDFGSRTLKVFEQLPHFGGVVFDDETDKVNRLINMMLKELSLRKRKFSDSGVGTYKEYSKRFSGTPAIVLAIDNFSSLLENYKKLEDNLIILTREGSSYGIYLCATTTNVSDIRTKIKQNFTSGIGLQLLDKFEYENILNEKIDVLADENTPGRGLVKSNLSVLEFQAAVSVKKEFPFINEELGKVFRSLQGEFNSSAIKIPEIPDDFTMSRFNEINPEIFTNKRYLPVGYDIDEATPIKMDIADSSCISISYTAKSGHENLLKMWANTLKNRESRLFTITNKNVENKDLYERVITNEEELYNFLEKTLIPIFQERKELKTKYESGKFSNLDEYINNEKHIYIFIEDMSFFTEMVYSTKYNMKDFVEKALSVSKGYLVYFISQISNADMTNEYNTKKSFRTFIGFKDGLHIGGNIDQQRIFEFDVPINERNKKLELGYGYINLGSKTIRIIVPKFDI